MFEERNNLQNFSRKLQVCTDLLGIYWINNIQYALGFSVIFLNKNCLSNQDESRDQMSHSSLAS